MLGFRMYRWHSKDDNKLNCIDQSVKHVVICKGLWYNLWMWVMKIIPCLSFEFW